MPGNNYPKLHNAMRPGLVGKGPDSEPPIDLDTMLKLTAAARFNGGKFEGVDLFLADPHTSIDSTKEDIQRLVDEIAGYGLAVGSVVALSGRRSAAVQRWVRRKRDRFVSMVGAVLRSATSGQWEQPSHSRAASG